MSPVRPLRPSDLPEVLRVQRSAYAEEYLEPVEAFARKLDLFPPGALGAVEDGSLVAYLFCHPWTLGEAAPLHAADLALPTSPDCLYIHDLAVRADRRGRGLSADLVDAALGIARRMDLNACALVAVQLTEPFWARHGFRRDRRLEYPPGRAAAYMVRP
ncbi:MAG: GNAT family N-acetyltransferase [Methanomassiliicoccus sp.]|nr:GNAT family N-acetyltransferase [Methanomassiliicoccus sp.]